MMSVVRNVCGCVQPWVAGCCNNFVYFWKFSVIWCDNTHIIVKYSLVHIQRFLQFSFLNILARYFCVPFLFQNERSLYFSYNNGFNKHFLDFDFDFMQYPWSFGTNLVVIVYCMYARVLWSLERSIWIYAKIWCGSIPKILGPLC